MAAGHLAIAWGVLGRVSALLRTAGDASKARGDRFAAVCTAEVLMGDARRAADAASAAFGAPPGTL